MFLLTYVRWKVQITKQGPRYLSLGTDVNLDPSNTTDIQEACQMTRTRSQKDTPRENQGTLMSSPASTVAVVSPVLSPTEKTP